MANYYGSDSDDSMNSDSDTEMPFVVDPYVNPDDITGIPLVLENWRMNIRWPHYEQQTFEPRDFPITREPPHHTVPLLIAKVHELEGKLEMAELELEDKASNQSVSITRQGTRDIRIDLNRFGEIYNENLQVVETLQTDHNTLVDQLNANRVIDENCRKALSEKVIRMGRKITRLEAEKASTSGTKKKKTKKT